MNFCVITFCGHSQIADEGLVYEKLLKTLKIIAENEKKREKPPVAASLRYTRRF